MDHLYILTFTTLWADSADDKLMLFFSNFHHKIGFDMLCKSSAKVTICMKCQTLLMEKIFQNASAEFFHSMLSVKYKLCDQKIFGLS